MRGAHGAIVLSPMASQSLSLLHYRWVRWSLYLAFMTLLGLINTGQSYLYCTATVRRALRLWPTLALGVCDWYLWAALTPAIIWLAHRFPFYPERWVGVWPFISLLYLLRSFIVFMFTIPVFRWVSPARRKIHLVLDPGESECVHDSLFLDLTGHLD